MKIIILSLFISIGVWADSTALFGRVINISENDILNVRSQSNYKSKKIAELPQGAYVGIEKCKKLDKTTWCRVYPIVQQWYEKFGDDSHKGWVNARYLKFSDRGYVIVKGVRNCAYALHCNDGKCEIVMDYSVNSKHEITKLHTEFVKRNLLKGESNFGAMPDNEDGLCNTGIFIEDYLKKYPNFLK